LTTKAITPAAPRAEHWPKTIGYYIAFVALGMVSQSLGPTLSGLAAHTNSQLSQVSFLFTARAFGYLLGSMGGGRLYDRVPGHPLMVSVLGVMVLTMSITPVLSLLWMLTVVLFVLGLAEGTLDVGGNALLIWVHRGNVGPFMNGLPFFFGLGAVIAPLVIARALIATGDITWAYWMLAVLLVPALLWLMRLPSPTRLSDAGNGIAEPTNYRLITLVVLFLFVNVGIEVCFGGWIYNYAIAMDLAGKVTAAYLTSAFWIAFAFGRLIGIPLSAYFRPRTLLLTNLIGGLVSVLIILLWPQSATALWLGVAGSGLAMASTFAVTVTWTERRITLTGAATSWFLVGAALSGMTLPLLIGQLFESQGPRVTIFVILGNVLAAFVIFALLMIYGGQPKRST